LSPPLPPNGTGTKGKRNREVGVDIENILRTRAKWYVKILILTKTKLKSTFY
jgi:hypothetical protein